MKIHRFRYSSDELVPYIDWLYFYHAWGMRGSQHTTPEGAALRNDALSLLHDYRDCSVNALFALCDARGIGDNIEIEGSVLPLLRQQHSDNGRPNLCLSDFVSPYTDRVGLFATAIEPSFELHRGDDPYRNLLVQIVADRLAEAAATLLHRNVRTDVGLWGYAPDENLTIEQLKREEYQGIRPAVGYPSLPDLSVITILDSIMPLSQIGVRLTESGAMIPHAAVCGLMISHPAARYFAIGKVDDEQLADYAARRSMSIEEVKRYLGKNM